MRLISFAVNNFRGIAGGLDNNRINFLNSNTIFIFGQNNVGKSTFLNAYDFLFSNRKPVEDDFYKKDDKLSIEFELEALIDSVDLSCIEESLPKKIDSFKKYISKDNIIKILRKFSESKEGANKLEISKAQDFTWDPVGDTWVETAFGSIGLTEVFQQLLPKPIIIKAMPTEEEAEQVVNNILSSKAKERLDKEQLEKMKSAQDTVKELQEEMYNPASIAEYKRQVNQHFQKLFTDTRIEFEDESKIKWTEDKFGKKFNIHFTRNKEDGTKDESIPTSYQTIGHGAVRSAIFSLLLMQDVAKEKNRIEDRKEYLVLFEEPELFLHPRLMKELRELIYLVSGKNYPYQVLCASHSPQMIDISKPDSSIIRMVKNTSGTKLYQINQEDFQIAKGAKSKADLKQDLYEVLRFNPYICESFYADEVILVEGPTEEILLRAILQKESNIKQIFIVNCGSITNIPFYQKIYSKFLIRYHVICDTDESIQKGIDGYGAPVFDKEIQGSIYEQFHKDSPNSRKCAGTMHVHCKNFESAHDSVDIPECWRFGKAGCKDSDGKPFNANQYWRKVLEIDYDKLGIEKVPIINAAKKIIDFSWN
ncbi:MAG: AAA family ATPase [Nanoarchaeota archaeon]|nr:AAA family ATPase [Nanoarchaeota archaeon]